MKTDRPGRSFSEARVNGGVTALPLQSASGEFFIDVQVSGVFFFLFLFFSSGNYSSGSPGKSECSFGGRFFWIINGSCCVEALGSPR